MTKEYIRSRIANKAMMSSKTTNEVVIKAMERPRWHCCCNNDGKEVAKQR